MYVYIKRYNIPKRVTKGNRISMLEMLEILEFCQLKKYCVKFFIIFQNFGVLQFIVENNIRRQIFTM